MVSFRTCIATIQSNSTERLKRRHAKLSRRAATPRGRRRVLRGESGRLQTGVGRVPCPSSRARVDGGLRGPACASRAARARRWMRFWSITDARVMQAMCWSAVAGGTCERVDLEDLLKQGRPPAGRLARGQRSCGDDRRRPVGSGRRRLLAHASRTVGIPPVVRRRDVAFVGDMAPRPGQELQRVDGLGPRRWPLRHVGAIRHRLRGPVVRQPLQRDGIPCAVPGEASGERAIVLRHPKGPTQTAVWTWNPECGQVSMPAAWSSSNSSRRTKSRSTARRK